MGRLDAMMDAPSPEAAEEARQAFLAAETPREIAESLYAAPALSGEPEVHEDDGSDWDGLRG